MENINKCIDVESDTYNKWQSLFFKIGLKNPSKFDKMQLLFGICSALLKYLNVSLGGITNICFPLI